MPGATVTRNPTLRRWQWFEFEQRQRHALAQQAPRYDDDPVGFARDVLGHDPWPMAETILRALAQPRARVAVKACHASGKTFSAAEAVMWCVATGGLAISTAPTSDQVERQLWGEIRQSHMAARKPLGGVLNLTEWRLAPNNYALGRSTDQGVRFQGYHARPDAFLLVVIDEAPGVRPDIFEAIEGIRAGGDVRVLALGNPTISSGPFYDAFASERAGWQTFTIDAFDTPNLAGLTLDQLLALPDAELDVAARPYLVTRRWVREKHAEWGAASPLWESRVRGQFPAQAEDALLSLAWLEAAGQRTIEPSDQHTWHAGIDVAGPGEDETVLVVRQGPAIVQTQAWAQPDPRGEVLAALAPYSDRLASVNVDTIGQGWYFARHLEDHGFDGRVLDVNVGAATSDPERYANLKAELYWGLRQRAEAGDFAGLTDPLALSQLAGIRYRHNARGQVVIESKDEARKRGVKSPDRAEAIMLAFAPLVEVEPGAVVLDEPVEISPF